MKEDGIQGGALIRKGILIGRRVLIPTIMSVPSTAGSYLLVHRKYVALNENIEGTSGSTLKTLLFMTIERLRSLTMMFAANSEKYLEVFVLFF